MVIFYSYVSHYQRVSYFTFTFWGLPDYPLDPRKKIVAHSGVMLR